MKPLEGERRCRDVQRESERANERLGEIQRERERERERAKAGRTRAEKGRLIGSGARRGLNSGARR